MALYKGGDDPLRRGPKLVEPHTTGEFAKVLDLEKLSDTQGVCPSCGQKVAMTGAERQRRFRERKRDADLS